MKSGEPVFYPLNGVGIFDSVVKQIFIDDIKTYYKVYFPLQKMTMFIPEDKDQKKRIRPLSTLEYLQTTRELFFKDFSKLEKAHNLIKKDMEMRKAEH